MYEVKKGKSVFIAVEAAHVDEPTQITLDVVTSAQTNHINQQYTLYLLNRCVIIKLMATAFII